MKIKNAEFYNNKIALYKKKNEGEMYEKEVK